MRFEGRSYELCAFTDDHITRHLATGRFYEEDLLRQVRALGLPGPYLDVGAFIGTHQVFFACECGAKTVAIEPDPEAYALLARNACRYQAGITLHAAVHDRWKSAQMVPAPAGNRGMAQIAEHGPIRVLRIDELDIPVPGLIKIDVEGMEMAVLRSAAWVIEVGRPVIVAEARTSPELCAIEEFLGPRGYDRSGPYAKTPTYLWRPRYD